MNRLLIVVLMLMWSTSYAGTGDTVPLCPDAASPDCVVPNWGGIGEPDGTDGAIAPRTDASLNTAPTIRSKPVAVQLMPAAEPSAMSTGDAPLKTVVSPQNLFPKETNALTTALKRARFKADGSIATGGAAISRAAADAARKAGKKYTLTLYVKVPQALKPEAGALLDKKVRAINDVLSGRYAKDAKPKA